MNCCDSQELKLPTPLDLYSIMAVRTCDQALKDQLHQMDKGELMKAMYLLIFELADGSYFINLEFFQEVNKIITPQEFENFNRGEVLKIRADGVTTNELYHKMMEHTIELYANGVTIASAEERYSRLVAVIPCQQPTDNITCECSANDTAKAAMDELEAYRAESQIVRNYLLDYMQTMDRIHA